ncbi:hypothetical protein MKX03_010179 [Papaver bracteatum]|nr:hypothetical protein MKX03_010179 [Papaver bracteatum]
MGLKLTLITFFFVGLITGVALFMVHLATIPITGMEEDVDIGEDIPGANCIDSIVPVEALFAQEVKKPQHDQFKPSEQVTLETFERDHACVVGGNMIPNKVKLAS